MFGFSKKKKCLQNFLSFYNFIDHPLKMVKRGIMGTVCLFVIKGLDDLFIHENIQQGFVHVSCH